MSAMTSLIAGEVLIAFSWRDYVAWLFFGVVFLLGAIFGLNSILLPLRLVIALFVFSLWAYSGWRFLCRQQNNRLSILPNGQLNLLSPDNTASTLVVDSVVCLGTYLVAVRQRNGQRPGISFSFFGAHKRWWVFSVYSVGSHTFRRLLIWSNWWKRIN